MISCLLSPHFDNMIVYTYMVHAGIHICIICSQQSVPVLVLLRAPKLTIRPHGKKLTASHYPAPATLHPRLQRLAGTEAACPTAFAPCPLPLLLPPRIGPPSSTTTTADGALAAVPRHPPPYLHLPPFFHGRGEEKPLDNQTTNSTLRPPCRAARTPSASGPASFFMCGWL